MNTLLIQIDNTPLPKGLNEDIQILDCRQITDFCSIVGDLLVGDLKDEAGRPLYRSIAPVGKMLMDFKAVDEDTFSIILEEWYDILGGLLHKGQSNDDIIIKFPQIYIDWLRFSNNPNYGQVGRVLQNENGKIMIPTEDIVDDIIASLIYRVSQTLRQNDHKFSFVVFSNPLIRNSSFVIKRVRMDDIEFMRFDSWADSIRKRKEEEEKEHKVIHIKDVSFRMIHVKGGTFMMGASPEWNVRDSFYENPQQRVSVNDFYIGETVVTGSLWEAVMENQHYFRGPNFPTEEVPWNEIQSFIHRLNTITGMHFRLPTEKEWEFAARGGVKSHGYKFSGSNNLDEVAWYDKVHPVATKNPNELGIYDMSGNVSEWCDTIYKTYSGESLSCVEFPSPGEHNVVRGFIRNCGIGEDDCRVTRRAFGTGVCCFRLAL